MDYYNLGVFVGIFVGIILVAIIIRLVRGEKLGKKDEYDERQEIVRGRGFKYGFFTLLIGIFAVIILKGGFDLNIPLSTIFLITLMLFLSITVFAVYCVMNDAYFSVTSKPKRFIIIMIVISIINFASGFITLANGEIDLSSDRMTGITNFICGFTFLILGIAMIIKNIMDKKEDGE